MTIDEYYAIVKRLGLRPTNVANVYRTPTGEFQGVPDARAFAPEQRAEIIERLKALMGISSERDSDAKPSPSP
jgi:hypothetical protein